MFNERGGRGGASFSNERRGGGDTGRGGRGDFRGNSNYNPNGANQPGGGHQGYQPNMNAGVAGASPTMGMDNNNDTSGSTNQRGAFRKTYPRGGATLGGDLPQYKPQYDNNNTFNSGGRGGMDSS